MAVHLSWSCDLCDRGCSRIGRSLYCCMWRKTYSVALTFTAPLCPAWTAHWQRKQKPSLLSRGKREKRKERETERQGGGEPGYLQPLLLGFSIIHTPGQLNALGPQLYTWYKTVLAHSNAHTDTFACFGDGVGVKRVRMLTARYTENGLFCMPTHIEACQGA